MFRFSTGPPRSRLVAKLGGQALAGGSYDAPGEVHKLVCGYIVSLQEAVYLVTRHLHTPGPI